jgi:flagellar M-ring protein FliF
MDQIRRIFEQLTLRQRITLGALVLALAGGIYGFVQWNHERSFQPLFSQLAPEDAGQITSRLREQGVEYRLSPGGDTVLAPASRIAELRLELAVEGLPKTGRIGFELFDKTNLTITDFQEHVNYQRALEGELERSIMALAEVDTARVHVTFAKPSVFVESRQPAKASVVLKLKTGRKLAPSAIQAITHLAASAIEGLLPEMVSVIDSRGNLLNRPKRSNGGEEPDDAQIEFRQKIERDLLAKVNQTLEPLLGPDHFRASASADVDFTSGEQSEETFDPTRSVMATQQRTEDVSGSAQAAGVPGTASSLPRPTSRPSESGKNVARRTEAVTYQSTRMVKRLKLPQGAIRRLSVSILLDQGLRWEGSGAKAKRVIEPPAPETMKKIGDLVTAAAGLRVDRGDQIIVESIPFEATLKIEPPGEPAGPGTNGTGAGGEIPLPAWVPAPLRNVAVLAGIVVGLLVLLILGAFVVMRKLKKKAPAAASGNPALPPGESAKAMAAAAGGASADVPPGLSAQSAVAELAERANLRKAEIEAEALKTLQLPEAAPKKGELLTQHISNHAKKDPIAVAQLIRNWLQADLPSK